MQKLAAFFIILGLVGLACWFLFKAGEKQDFEKSKELIVMRKIAHDLLLYAKDSTSRILPIRQTSPNDFIIPFESQFSFLPDSLVSIINKVVLKNHLTTNYIVNVLKNSTNEIVFGYSMFSNQQENIIPCGRRLQPTESYKIHIKFQPQPPIFNDSLFYASLLSAFAGLLGVLFKVKTKPNSNKDEFKPLALEEKPNSSSIMIGKYLFYPKEQRLEFDDMQIILTAKETKLLSIFSTQLNQVVERERLQKEVWENEGVFVSRSLDMFISKLRKKFDKDTCIKIVNIHGKGYKLLASSNKELSKMP